MRAISSKFFQITSNSLFVYFFSFKLVFLLIFIFALSVSTGNNQMNWRREMAYHRGLELLKDSFVKISLLLIFDSLHPRSAQLLVHLVLHSMRHLGFKGHLSCVVEFGRSSCLAYLQVLRQSNLNKD